MEIVAAPLVLKAEPFVRLAKCAYGEPAHPRKEFDPTARIALIKL
jgi:hypothetical protein